MGIARILYQRPRFVILDEPLTKVDDASLSDLLSLLPKDMGVLILSRRANLCICTNVVNLGDNESSWTEGPSAALEHKPAAAPSSRPSHRPPRRGQPMHQVGASKVSGGGVGHEPVVALPPADSTA